ncbi:hypothetical protein I79_012312 [Cricetulus griseus]|uniref:Uncharacterized protein n=1 Tax=Cricetulus griseus TaxID=10029 RepID=G3HNH3_CRIGR|nr:hypothetical protein I79_012312 [Cricetulus griseus]
MLVFILPFQVIITRTQNCSFTTEYIPGREFNTTLCIIITLFVQWSHKTST